MSTIPAKGPFLYLDFDLDLSLDLKPQASSPNLPPPKSPQPHRRSHTDTQTHQHPPNYHACPPHPTRRLQHARHHGAIKTAHQIALRIRRFPAGTQHAVAQLEAPAARRAGKAEAGGTRADELVAVVLAGQQLLVGAGGDGLIDAAAGRVRGGEGVAAGRERVAAGVGGEGVGQRLVGVGKGEGRRWHGLVRGRGQDGRWQCGVGSEAERAG